MIFAKCKIQGRDAKFTHFGFSRQNARSFKRKLGTKDFEKLCEYSKYVKSGSACNLLLIKGKKLSKIFFKCAIQTWNLNLGTWQQQKSAQVAKYINFTSFLSFLLVLWTDMKGCEFWHNFSNCRARAVSKYLTESKFKTFFSILDNFAIL